MAFWINRAFLLLVKSLKAWTLWINYMLDTVKELRLEKDLTKD